VATVANVASSELQEMRDKMSWVCTLLSCPTNWRSRHCSAIVAELLVQERAGRREVLGQLDMKYPGTRVTIRLVAASLNIPASHCRKLSHAHSHTTRLGILLP
jgi:hypothetical protein